jgi:hypothetical protein
MDSQIQNAWVERPYLARHVDQSDAQQFLQKYSSELKSRGRHIQQQASRGNVEPFIEHADWLQNNLGPSPLITSAYDAAVQFNEKYNLPKAELASNRDYSQALYHDAFQHGIPERLVGVVDKTAPTMLTAADESRAVSLQMQQEHLKRNASPEIWYRYMQTITEPKNDFNLVGQEVAALSQKNPDTSTDKLRLAAVNRFPSLSRESLQGLRTNLNDPYLADLSVSERLSQAGRLKAGLESFAAKVRQNPEGGVSSEVKEVADAAFKKLAFY